MEQKIIEDRIYQQSRRAAKSALIQWYSGQWQRQSEEIDDLNNDLLEWYLTRPETQRLMASLDDPQIMVMFRKRARQILSIQALNSDIFNGKVLYTSTAVKDALKNGTSNKYLKKILPIAISKLNPTFREAIDLRYHSEDKKSPQTMEGKNALKWAHYELTRMVNALYITDETENKQEIFPDTIKIKGQHGDPTANIAIMLMEQHPDFQDEYLYESPWEQVSKGAATETVIEFGPSGHYRLTAAEADLLLRVPGLVDLFIDQKREDWENA